MRMIAMSVLSGQDVKCSVAVDNAVKHHVPDGTKMIFGGGFR